MHVTLCIHTSPPIWISLRVSIKLNRLMSPAPIQDHMGNSSLSLACLEPPTPMALPTDLTVRLQYRGRGFRIASQYPRDRSGSTGAQGYVYGIPSALSLADSTHFQRPLLPFRATA